MFRTKKDLQNLRTRNLTKFLYNASGFVSLSLGVIGIFLPLLPTTPFVLLSAWCFARGSDRFLNWLINHRFFGKIIRDYKEEKAVSRKNKIFALTLLWATILFSIVFVVESFVVDLILFVIATSVTIHILKLRSKN